MVHGLNTTRRTSGASSRAPSSGSRAVAIAGSTWPTHARQRWRPTSPAGEDGSGLGGSGWCGSIARNTCLDQRIPALKSRADARKGLSDYVRSNQRQIRSRGALTAVSLMSYSSRALTSATPPGRTTGARVCTAVVRPMRQSGCRDIAVLLSPATCVVTSVRLTLDISTTSGHILHGGDETTSSMIMRALIHWPSGKDCSARPQIARLEVPACRQQAHERKLHSADSRMTSHHSIRHPSRCIQSGFRAHTCRWVGVQSFGSIVITDATAAARCRVNRVI